MIPHGNKINTPHTTQRRGKKERNDEPKEKNEIEKGDETRIIRSSRTDENEENKRRRSRNACRNSHAMRAENRGRMRKRWAENDGRARAARLRPNKSEE
jgi:hypothetical protein